MEPNGSTSPKEKPQRSLSSNSGLRYGSLINSISSLTQVDKPAISNKRAYVAVAVLCYINLLNYMERYTIAGVLTVIQKYFDISDSTAGLLQTVFICSFLLLAPFFGYLGDRYNRIYIMAGGLSVWLVTAAASSFVTKSSFWLLVVLRSLVGVGEASYSTIAPTIIGDLFTGSKRLIMISAFYIFIPVGSGLGYIVGSSVTHLTGDWHWALRVTPILGFVGLLLLLFLCPNPPRGAAETKGVGVSSKESSYREDVKYLLKNKSYVWSSMGVTAMAFLTGALAFWVPTFLSRAQVSAGIRPPCTKEPCNPQDSLIFGGVTVASGILGVLLGTTLSRYFRTKVSYADPVICAVGMLGSTPCLFGVIFLASTSIPVTYVFVFLAELLLSLNWSLLADILLYVVVPNRRSTAEALQITVCHLLGDAGSPYLIGAVSDAIRNSKPANPQWSFRSLKYSFLICPFIGILGGLFFLMTSLYITEDKKAAQRLVEEDPPPENGPVSEPHVESTNETNK